MSIRISEQHGVNPSLSQCFYCGKDKNEIMLLGRLTDDAEAPRRAVFNYEPCDECAEFMKQGIIFIGARNGESGYNPYRNGRFAVIKDDAVRRMMKPGALVEEILRRRVAFIDEETWDALGISLNAESSDEPTV